jgi:protease I
MPRDYPAAPWLPGSGKQAEQGAVMAGKLDGKRIAILATDGVEEVELTRPRDAVTAEGAQVDLVSLQAGELQAMNHDLEPASTFPVDRTAAQASPSDYDALILPGGTVNADRLRMDDDGATVSTSRS